MNLVSFRLKRERQFLAGLIALVMAGMAVRIRLQPDLVTRQTPARNIPAGVTVMDRIVEGGVSFLGYRLETLTPGPGDEVFITAYWRANTPIADDLQINILLTQGSQVVATQTYRHLAYWPVKRWPLQEYVLGAYRIRAPETPGQYQIKFEVGTCNRRDLAPCETINRRNISDFQGNIEKQITLPVVITVR